MTQNSPDFWTQASRQLQQSLAEGWTKAMQAFKNVEAGAAEAGIPGMETLVANTPEIHFANDKLQALQQQYCQDALALCSQGLTQGFQPPKIAGDRRFADPAWNSNPVAAYAAAIYTLNARTLLGMADAVEADTKTRNRIRFAVEQWVAAAAPSNFLAFNAEAIKKAIETKGESIALGVRNLVHDIQQGHVSMTDESQFQVGKNVATTEGAVVFENDLFQLIEYKPLTAKVYEKPFLLVPPCINKFYILDL
ncbi:MAG: class I poly(R)-hydroxyalkanoic acid synthase, partial [Rhodoferax sp.]|nr:class I poly(R)-hydroxyalkanoic acid synthase [Rhodoferax sp.]